MSSVQSGFFSLISIVWYYSMCSATPVVEFTSGDPGLQEFLWKNREFALTIKDNVAKMKRGLGAMIPVEGEEQLQYFKETLAIEQVNLLQCHPSPNDMEACFNQILAGLYTYYGYLGHMNKCLLPILTEDPSHSKLANLLTTIEPDVYDLFRNFEQQMQQCRLTTVTYVQEENQANPAFLGNNGMASLTGSYLILANFQRFLETTIRAMRSWSTSV